MIGIIGYGMVGRAVEFGFNKTDCIISDPAYNSTTIIDVCAKNPDAIFVCVPTPTDNTNYSNLINVLNTIFICDYTGIVVVKSTVLPEYIQDFDVVYNPEFLSRATANKDFVEPPFVLIGGQRATELLKLYKKYSIVNTDKVFLTDVKTAALAKYVMNSFYALKVTYMNEIYDVAETMGVNYRELTEILANQPWMGTNHFQVPGPDGSRGFGGPCLPKDTQAFTDKYKIALLNLALLLNEQYRKGTHNGN